MQTDMTVGKPMKMLLNFTIPVFLGNVFQQLYSMADAVIVGKFVGTGVYKVLKNQEEEMTAKIGCKVKIRKILVRNLEKAAGKVDDPAVLTNSWEDIKADPPSAISQHLFNYFTTEGFFPQHFY